MNDEIKNYYDEIKNLKNDLLNLLNNYDNLEVKQKKLILTQFKTFCTYSFHFVKDWSKKYKYLANEYIDICHGIANGTKHLKITKTKNRKGQQIYNSEKPIFRISTDTLMQSSTGAYTYKENTNLHIEPNDDKLIIESNTNTGFKIYPIREIIINTFDTLEIITQKL